MYRLSSIIEWERRVNLWAISFSFLFLLFSFNLSAQSPHGEQFTMNCAACHTSDSWEIPAKAWTNGELVIPNQSGGTATKEHFNHSETAFPLEGGHAATDCRLCHEALVFTETSTECIACHTDLHNMTVGSDCARCHTVNNWLIDDVTTLHQDNGFPLLGSHAIISCDECHVSETGLQFHRLGNECVNCHLQDYMSTTAPNHQELGYSKECMDCHDINAFDWGSNILHDFFPLVKGHDISDCNACHSNPDFSGLSPECIACHQADYDAALNPDHKALGFGMDCSLCHTLDLNWMPAEFKQHDTDYFPIYSGEHKGEWSECMECHPNPSNYSVFTCTTCHKKGETDGEHDDVGGYVYESGACLACHPDGKEGSAFDHNKTDFPLTGAHVTVDCNQCHANGYAGTPTECSACHLTDFQQTTAPDHEQLNISTDCASCHTTNPNWMPATFVGHDDYWPLKGAHVSADCADCHNSTFTNTPTTCFGCHEDDYNQANDPNHQSAGFPTDCAQCHSETAWGPASFDHDGMYFPIYSGKHKGEWNDCAECHTTPGNYAAFSCIDCHEHNDPSDMQDEHEGVQNYQFLSSACYECHPKGD